MGENYKAVIIIPVICKDKFLQITQQFYESLPNDDAVKECAIKVVQNDKTMKDSKDWKEYMIKEYLKSHHIKKELLHYILNDFKFFSGEKLPDFCTVGFTFNRLGGEEIFVELEPLFKELWKEKIIYEPLCIYQREDWPACVCQYSKNIDFKYDQRREEQLNNFTIHDYRWQRYGLTEPLSNASIPTPKAYCPSCKLHHHVIIECEDLLVTTRDGNILQHQLLHCKNCLQRFTVAKRI